MVIMISPLKIYCILLEFKFHQTTNDVILLFIADEVDVIGYGSHGSDLDDQLSVQSASSDSGIGLGNVASIGHFPHLSIADSV